MHSTWSLWYRSHFILINLNLKPRSTQSILLCTGIIESAVCRLGMLTSASAALPFRYPIPIFFFRMIPLWNSGSKSRESYSGASLPKSSADLLLLWLPWHFTVLVLLQFFFLGGGCILYFCFFHLVSFMYTFLSTSAWTVEIPRLGLGLSHDS